MTPNRFNEAQKHSKNKLVCNQVHYNIQYREAEVRGVLKQAQDNDIMLVAWRPIQKGSFPTSQLMDELTRKYNKTPMQIAINWLIAQPNVVTISKTSNREHLLENLGALDWTMDADDIERIRTDFPEQVTVSDAVPLDYAADMDP